MISLRNAPEALAVVGRFRENEAVAGLDGGGVRGFIWPQSASGTGATIYRVTAMSVDLKELTDLPGNSNER